MEAKQLTGADLDLAVAMTGEWKTAHELFPTMTLDPTFKGAHIVDHGDERVCYLEPRNPFRQGPQEYSPSTDWRIGGQIIEREGMAVMQLQGGTWAGFHPINPGMQWTGPTPLIAAMRAFVAGKTSEQAVMEARRESGGGA